jgi:hypothetical protein
MHRPTMGLNPDLKIIFASYSDALGERASIDLQRILNSDSAGRRTADTGY